MGFGQTPNQELGPFAQENEPSSEEEEGLSGLFGEQAQNRIQGIQRNLGAVSPEQNLRFQNTSLDAPRGLGNFREARNNADAAFKTQNEARRQLEAIQRENDPSQRTHKKSIEAEAYNRGAKNVRTETGDHVVGIAETDTEEERGKKREKFQEALALLEEKLRLKDIGEVVEELKKPWGETKIRGVLAEKYTPDEVDGIIARLLDDRTNNKLSVLRRLKAGEAAALENPNIAREMIEAEDLDAFMEKNKDKVEAFRDFIQKEERLQKLDEEYEQRKELEQVEPALKEAAPRALRALSAATAALLAKSGVSPDILSALPPAGVAAVENVVKEGGTRVVGAMLANGVSSNDESFIGRIAGQYVSLDFADQNLYLVGENAADRANQSFYPIDPPTPAGFEKVLIHSVGEQNRMPFIANHSEQAQAMWERVVGDPGDESLPEEGNINRFRNFLVLLIGEGNPDESGEGKRLEKLGILTKGTSTVNRSRIDLFIRALEKFVPSGLVMHEGDSTATSGSESPSFDYEDALTLATLWDKDNRRMPESINELKDLTSRRQKGEDVTSRKFV